MTKETTSFVYVTYILSTPEKVFEAITKPDVARRYWGHENVSDWNPDRNGNISVPTMSGLSNSSARSLRSRRRPVSSSPGRMLRRPPIRQATAG